MCQLPKIKKKVIEKSKMKLRDAWQEPNRRELPPVRFPPRIDSQMLEFRLQRCPLQPQPRRRPSRPANLPVALPQSAENVLAFRRLQRFIHAFLLRADRGQFT